MLFFSTIHSPVFNSIHLCGEPINQLDMMTINIYIYSLIGQWVQEELIQNTQHIHTIIYLFQRLLDFIGDKINCWMGLMAF